MNDPEDTRLESWWNTFDLVLWPVLATLSIISLGLLPLDDDADFTTYLFRIAVTGLACAAAWTNYTWHRYGVGTETSVTFYKWAYLTGAFAFYSRTEGGNTFYTIASLVSGVIMLIALYVWVGSPTDDE